MSGARPPDPGSSRPTGAAEGRADSGVTVASRLYPAALAEISANWRRPENKDVKPAARY